MTNRVSFLSLLTATIFAGCSNGNPALPAPTFAGVSSLTKNWVAPDVKQNAPDLLYVAIFEGPDDSCILAYRLRSKNTQPAERICGGPLSGPNGLAVDRKQNLWVADFYGHQILRYSPGATDPSFTIPEPNYNPCCLAVDKAGTVYVANYSQAVGSSPPGNVMIYPQGSTKASVTLSDPSIAGISGMAIDKTQDIFVVNNFPNNYSSATIGEFKLGSTGSYTFSTVVPQQNYYGEMATDDAGNLITVDQSQVSVYSTTTWTIINQLAGAAGDAVALNRRARKLYVAENASEGANGGTVVEYSYPGDQQLRVVFDGANDGSAHPVSIAVSPRNPIK